MPLNAVSQTTHSEASQNCTQLFLCGRIHDHHDTCGREASSVYVNKQVLLVLALTTAVDCVSGTWMAEATKDTCLRKIPVPQPTHA